ncbi:MAG TPA: MFS transporter [Bryobacteraceae bacterium]|jgi:MFS family permease
MESIGFVEILRTNPNCRYTWMGQVVSEVGDHFNNIAVLSLTLAHSGSGLAVAGIMIARALPAIFAGPLAGVALDRFDRKRIMIASDLTRFVIALGFILCIDRTDNTLLYVLSAVLMFASPFFTAGRASILPTITTKDELHTANSLTQTTSWAMTAVGAYLGGHSVNSFGFRAAFVFNAVSFLASALAISQLKPVEGGSFRVLRDPDAPKRHPWQDYLDGLRYLRSVPLLLGIAMISVGWATGGGAAQILFSLFGELVFKRGPGGIGDIWGSAALGLIVGGFFAHRIAKHLSYRQYKGMISIAYVIHGAAYVIFSQMRNYAWALGFIGLSRMSVAVSSVMNSSQMLRHTANEYRGRVMATTETLSWATQMLSMAGAGLASTTYSPRTIGAVAGILSGSTGIWWLWLNWAGKLPEPAVNEQESDVEVHDPVN